MELYCPNGLLGGCVCRKLYVGGRGYALVVLGDGCDGVAMAHPYLRVLLESLEEGIGSVKLLKVCTTVLA